MPLPNETLNTAIAITPIPQPQALTESLSFSSNNNAFYTFTLTNRSSFIIRPPDNSVPSYFNSPDIALLDSVGNLVERNGQPQISTNSGVLPNLISTILEPGTYYIRLFSADFSAPNRFGRLSVDYNLTYQANPGATSLPIPYDIAGNTPDTALNLGALNTYSYNGVNQTGGLLSRGIFTNILTSTNSDDYYQFELSSNLASEVFINLTLTGLQSNADLTLYQDTNRNSILDPDELANAITSSQSGTHDEALYRLETVSAFSSRYFVRVNRADADTAYTLNISTGNPGELLASEFEVGNLGAIPRSYTGSLSNDNTADLYQFTVLSPANLNLELLSQSGNTNLKLYERSPNGGDTFLQGVSSGLNANQLTRTLAPGVYYVQLTGANGTNYSLNFSANTILPTERVSLTTTGGQIYGESLNYSFIAPGSFYPALSGDGRYVAFTSWSSNIVSGDTNNAFDVFVRDRQTGTTSRVSVASDGTQGNWGTTIGGPSPISADGRYVVFTSGSSNLVANDTNSDPPEAYTFEDAFVHDLVTGTTTRVNVASDGTEANNGGGTIYPTISANGRYITFSSVASNLVANDTNGARNSRLNPDDGMDIFVHDLQTGITTRESVAANGTEANDISLGSQLSGDGRYLVFQSFASNLVSGDTNNRPDVFLRDRQTGQTTRISVAADGTQMGGTNPAISTDGRYISYTSSGNIFLYDRVTAATTQVSFGVGGVPSNGTSYVSSLSAEGRYVVFNSDASNLVPGDTNNQTDVFRHDRTTGQTRRVSLAYDGSQGNGNSAGRYYDRSSAGPDAPVISADGRYVVFTSAASNLVEGDTNLAYDIFVRDLEA